MLTLEEAHARADDAASLHAAAIEACRRAADACARRMLAATGQAEGVDDRARLAMDGVEVFGATAGVLARSSPYATAALALAEALGLDLRATADVIMASSGASWIFGDRVPRALDGDWQPRAASRILAKDVGIACDVAARVRAGAAFAQAARRAFVDTVDAGYGEDDDAAIVRRARERLHGGR